MADVFDLYVKDNRTIQFNLTEPIMLEDSHVSDWVFHIPRVLNNIDMSGWAWWLVYINARGQKYSELLELSEDPESPLEKCIATYSVDYGMSIKAGTVRFSLEAINAEQTGEIENEWHTKTYQTKVQDTLQGNQVEYAEAESDIISALIVEVQNKVSQLVGGATPEPKNLIADMTDPQKVYLYVGSEPNEHAGHWYYHNGSTWVSGGVYSAGIVDAVPTQGSTNAVSSGGVYDALGTLSGDIDDLKSGLSDIDGRLDTTTNVVNSKAPGIYDDSAAGYNFENLLCPDRITFIGNEFAFGTAKYADQKNYMPRCSLYSGTNRGVAFKRKGNFLILNNKPTESSYQEIYDFSISSKPIPAGKYKYRILKDNGQSDIKTEGIGYLYWWYGTEQHNVTVKTPAASDERETEVTFEKPVTRIRPLIGYHMDNTYDDFRVWISLYPTGTVFVDTGEVVQSDEVYSFEAGIRNLNTINTMQHDATVHSIVDTKTYVDNHLPTDVITKEGLIYVSPEMFGAIGNNTGDDSEAINACVLYAINNGKAVRGFGRYRTSSPIEIDGDNNDVYLRSINYIGSDYALKIAGRFNRFRFGNITATASGGKGIYIFDSAKNSVKETDRNVIECDIIRADSCCIKVLAGTGKYILYTVLRIKTLISNNSNCIETSGSVSELSCFDTYFQCPVGWCFEGGMIKLSNCTIESNCNGGVYASMAEILNCRAVELMDCLMPGNPHYGQRSGILFKNKPLTNVSGGTYIKLNSAVYYDSIDLSEVNPPNDGSSKGSIYNHFTGVVDNIIRFGDLNYVHGHFNIGAKMLLHGNDKVCVPLFNNVCHITTQTYDMREPRHLLYATDFIIESDNCEIWLSPSYCAEGYNKFTVDMSNKMATIYDRRGGILFDPTGKDNGVYMFEAIVDTSISDSHQNASYPIYSGYNDVWNITRTA